MQLPYQRKPSEKTQKAVLLDSEIPSQESVGVPEQALESRAMNEPVGGAGEERLEEDAYRMHDVRSNAQRMSGVLGVEFVSGGGSRSDDQQRECQSGRAAPNAPGGVARSGGFASRGICAAHRLPLSNLLATQREESLA